MTHTHTYAILEVSEAAHREIAGLLCAAAELFFGEDFAKAAPDEGGAEAAVRRVRELAHRWRANAPNGITDAPGQVEAALEGRKW